MIQCRFCGGIVTLEEFEEEHSDRSCMMEADQSREAEQTNAETDESDREFEDLVAIKKTNSVGQSRWHLFGSSSGKKSLCGHVEVAHGLYDRSGRQLARKVNMDSIDELDNWLGKVCQNCLRILETKQPDYTPPSVRDEKMEGYT